MGDRTTLIDGFLSGCRWENAERRPLAGDASNRRYLRLNLNGEGAVLMDAPPDKGEDVRPFVQIARWLCNGGLSAPDIHLIDEQNGFLLLEDLGDGLFARLAASDPALETPLYEAATDLLVDLHKLSPPPGMTAYTPPMMADMSALAYDWYLRGCGLPPHNGASEFIAQFQDILETFCPETEVVALRDYHAENLLWLPDRSGTARVGLLDFQDALLGHRAYDLVSLLLDIRRNVSPQVQQAMLRRYLDATGLDAETFGAAYAALGLQRNLRILGVFARLCLGAGKPHYVDYLPHVWVLVLQTLNHPALLPLRDRLMNDLPAPSPALMQRMKDQCATIPMQ